MTAPSSGEQPALAEAGLRGQLERVAKNLFTLEVNTILKDGMTATRMPSSGHALIDIVNDYDTKLCELGSTSVPAATGCASFAVFDALRTRAKAIYENAPGARRTDLMYSASALLMLCRIRDNSDQLKGVMTALSEREKRLVTFTRDDAPIVRLLPIEIMIVRKIWEIGTEEIAMQTVIQLDGDVVTRLQHLYAQQKDHPLVAIHNSAVSTAIGTWNHLVDTLGSFISGVAQLFLHR